MYTNPTPFHISELLTSVVEVITSHSDILPGLLDVHVNDQVPDRLIGESDRIRQSLIIVVERALIQHPGVPIQLACALVRRSNDRATVSFSVIQQLTPKQHAQRTCSNQMNGVSEQEDTSSGMSMSIAERIIGECGGNMHQRPSNGTSGEVCFWIPVGLTTTQTIDDAHTHHQENLEIRA